MSSGFLTRAVGNVLSPHRTLMETKGPAYLGKLFRGLPGYPLQGPRLSIEYSPERRFAGPHGSGRIARFKIGPEPERQSGT
jgi:hypothetical protein